MVKMARFETVVGHGLPEDEAVRRIKNEMADLKTRFADKISGLEEKWDGNTCKFSLSVKGFSGSGTMVVKPVEIEIAGELPFFAVVFKKQIELTIRDRLGKLLG
jgi:hypothetical protein